MAMAVLWAACSSAERQRPTLGDTNGGESDSAAPAAACLEMPSPQPGPRSLVTFAVQLDYASSPIVFGEPFRLLHGGAMTLSNFRFYISDLMLVRANGPPVPVDLVAADGTPIPYNVHLAIAGEDAAMSFRVAATPGTYTGVSFVLGLNDGCNNHEPAHSKPPLTIISEMSWGGPPLGYLFLRHEARVAGVSGPDAPPSEIHMGGWVGKVFAPHVTAPGPLTVVADASVTVRLRLALEQLFKAATLPAEPNGVFAVTDPGERARQNAPKVPLFTVARDP
jgi:hypothetical protein